VTGEETPAASLVRSSTTEYLTFEASIVHGVGHAHVCVPVPEGARLR